MIAQTNILSANFPAFNTSGILETPEMRFQVFEDMR